jgi:hypothetical protein
MLTVGLALGLYTDSARDELRNGRAGAHPALVADRLFFGRAIPGGGAVTEADWTAFLRDVITPRFPEGLTVWRAEGRWTDPSGRLVREPVVVLEVLHPAGSRADSSLSAIAREYKDRFRQGSVLRVSASVVGRFYE